MNANKNLKQAQATKCLTSEQVLKFLRNFKDSLDWDSLKQKMEKLIRDRSRAKAKE
jgi:hypothetical protein